MKQDEVPAKQGVFIPEGRLAEDRQAVPGQFAEQFVLTQAIRVRFQYGQQAAMDCVDIITLAGVFSHTMFTIVNAFRVGRLDIIA